MEKNIPYVICVLHQYCLGKCELAVHSSVFYADNKILHSSNYRFLLFILKFPLKLQIQLVDVSLQGMDM